MDSRYSPITETDLPSRRIAQYTIISPAPEDDVIGYMERWAAESGLRDWPGYAPKRIGWDFPFVSPEQTQRFGLRGYVAAFVLPEGFEPGPGVLVTDLEAGHYARITITDPHSDSFETIPKAYRALIDYAGDRLSGRQAFEEEYDRGGVHYMDVYVPMNG